MKASQVKEYNKNNIKLELVNIEKPAVGERDLLVKVSTAGVNPLDNMISRGEVKMIVPYELPLVVCRYSRRSRVKCIKI